MIGITVNNIDYAKGMLSDYPKMVNQAAGAAVDRTITHVKAQVSKEVRKRYVVSAKEVKKALSVRRAKTSELKGEVRATGRPLLLSNFRVTGSSKTLRAKVLKASKPKPVPGLFRGKARSGYEGYMHRTQKEAYPLRVPAGPSVPSMMGMVIEPLIKDAQQYLNQRFLHEVSFRAAKIAAGEADFFERKKGR